MKYRVHSLLLLGPVLAIVLTLGWWIASLRQQVRLLEARVETLESLPTLAVSFDVSEVGVPRSVDEAMMMDGIGRF